MLSNVDLRDWIEVSKDQTLNSIPEDSVVSFQGNPKHLWRFSHIEGDWGYLYDLYDKVSRYNWLAAANAPIHLWYKRVQGDN